jgi:hypothetical protein
MHNVDINVVMAKQCKFEMYFLNCKYNIIPVARIWTEMRVD